MSIKNLLFYQCPGAKSKYLWILLLNVLTLTEAWAYVELGTLNRVDLDESHAQALSYGLKSSYIFTVNPFWRLGPSVFFESESATNRIGATNIQYNSKTAALGLSQQFFYWNFDQEKFLTLNADIFGGLTRTQVSYDDKTASSYSETVMSNVNSQTFYAFVGPALKFKNSLQVGAGGFFRQESYQTSKADTSSRIEIVNGTNVNLTSEGPKPDVGLGDRQSGGVYLNLAYRFAGDL